MAKMFVLVIPPFGSAMIGKLSKDNFEQWRKRLEVLKLIQPKRIVVAQSNAQSSDPSTQALLTHIVPAYFGDTDQQLLYIDNVCVELIGEIEVEANVECCPAARKMFEAYIKSIRDYDMRHSNILMPNIRDINAVSNGIAPIPFKRQ
jgi:hypothetical protein